MPHRRVKSQNGSYHSDMRGDPNLAIEFLIFCIIDDSKHPLWWRVCLTIISRGEYILNVQLLSFPFSYLRAFTKSSSIFPKSPASLKRLLGFLISVTSMQKCLWGQQITVSQKLERALECSGSLHKKLPFCRVEVLSCKLSWVPLRCSSGCQDSWPLLLSSVDLHVSEALRKWLPFCASVSPAGRCWWWDSATCLKVLWGEKGKMCCELHTVSVYAVINLASDVWRV